VVDPDESARVDAGVLPADERVLVLSDTWSIQGVVPSVEVDDGMEQMNGTEGPQILVNGQVAPELTVAAGGAVRFRVVNSAITRFFRLSVPGKILYRVGGEGGLLDAVRVEGGEVVAERFNPDRGNLLGSTTLSLGYDRGEILLAPGERADLVLVTDGEPGEVWPLRWEDTARGRHEMWVDDGTLYMADAEDDGSRPGIDIAAIRLVDAPTEPFAIDEGDPLLTRLGRAVPRADDRDAIDWLGADGVTLDESMDHLQNADGSWTMTTWFGMNDVSWHPDHHAGPDQPEAPNAKHAQLGDTLQWEIRNTSGMSHPYHLHGFSMQPYAWVQCADPHAVGSDGTAARVDWTYPEWEDTLLLPGHSSVFVRVVLADPAGDGSAAGRWMQHCHILQHGENGMMSELVVRP
jgi:FtsP/CotA-like multicopper oxidase with cupredoxin domain